MAIKKIKRHKNILIKDLSSLVKSCLQLDSFPNISRKTGAIRLAFLFSEIYLYIHTKKKNELSFFLCKETMCETVSVCLQMVIPFYKHWKNRIQA